MNSNETTMAGGSFTSQPHVYQKINLQTWTGVHVGCQAEWEGELKIYDTSNNVHMTCSC